jgi:GMP synthase (glutamine-hydrolysing)
MARDAGPTIMILNDEHRITGPEDTGHVAEGIHRAGGRIEWIDLAHGGSLPRSIDAYDGIVLTGGEMSVFDESEADRVARLTDTYLAFQDAGKPVLGLCLGAQIMAQAHGARVERMDRTQFGFEVVRPTETAADDPVLAGIAPSSRVFEGHRDRFAVPQDAVTLMVGDEEPNQVFRVGAAGYAFQCHFEATRALIIEWIKLYDGDLAPWLGEDGEARKAAVLRDLDEAMPEAERFAERVMQGWMGLFG